jgi:hypothetical protein
MRLLGLAAIYQRPNTSKPAEARIPTKSPADSEMMSPGVPK